MVCQENKHELLEVLRFPAEQGKDCTIVRWCEVCGTLTVSLKMSGKERNIQERRPKGK
jgi:hypothetical protein